MYWRRTQEGAKSKSKVGERGSEGMGEGSTVHEEMGTNLLDEGDQQHQRHQQLFEQHNAVIQKHLRKIRLQL